MTCECACKRTCKVTCKLPVRGKHCTQAPFRYTNTKGFALQTGALKTPWQALVPTPREISRSFAKLDEHRIGSEQKRPGANRPPEFVPERSHMELLEIMIPDSETIMMTEVGTPTPSPRIPYLGGPFGPEKKCLAPRTRPPFGRTPPPVLGFSIKDRPPPPPSLLPRTPSSLRRAEKNNVHQDTKDFCLQPGLEQKFLLRRKTAPTATSGTFTPLVTLSKENQFQRAENGGLDPSWLNLAFLGRPDLQSRGPKLQFLDLWTENRGAPQTPNSTTTAPTPHSRPSDNFLSKDFLFPARIRWKIVRRWGAASNGDAEISKFPALSAF